MPKDKANDKCKAIRPKLLYHRLMLPNWLRNNAQWNCAYEGNDLNLIIKADSSDCMGEYLSYSSDSKWLPRR